MVLEIRYDDENSIVVLTFKNQLHYKVVESFILATKRDAY